ncbi:MAG: histidine phosphatase family protein [Planctomycetes bacterium]|nr:histidine phosphatase family protein [Planctomycetota bacterium]
MIVVRHAEKTAATDDPPLSDAGQVRARTLAKLLAATKVTRVFTTDYARTRQTVAPLAEAHGCAPKSYDARKSDEFAKGLLDLTDGEVVVVAGHSNTVPMMVRALGGSLTDLDERGYLGEDEYDRVVVVTVCGVVGAPRTTTATTLDLRVDAAG